MIVAIGDSITAGQHLPPEHLPWPLLITGHNVLAKGVPSDTTRLGLERFPADVQAHQPAGVIIQFGHNDANRWQTDRGMNRVSSKAYVANLEEMIGRTRTFGAYPWLCSLTPSYRSDQHAADVAVYDVLLRDVASANGVTVIDVRTAFGDRDDLLLDDGLHLNAAGHELYAATVQPFLDEKFG